MTAERTAIPFFAAIADIWSLSMRWTELFLEVFAEFKTTCTALGAIHIPSVIAGRADIPDVLADVPVNTRIAATAAVLDDIVVPHFL